MDNLIGRNFLYRRTEKNLIGGIFKILEPAGEFKDIFLERRWDSPIYFIIIKTVFSGAEEEGFRYKSQNSRQN